MRHFLRSHWRDALDLVLLGISFVSLFGLVFGLMQVVLQQRQLSLALAERPDLEYTYNLNISDADQQIITLVMDKLVSDFYRRMSEQVAPHSIVDARIRHRNTRNFTQFLLSFCVFPCDSVAEKALHD